MSYVHLTISERVKIEAYLEIGFSMRKIAQSLRRQPSTISRELKQNPSYNAINVPQYASKRSACVNTETEVR
nr:helix-turn-helix domain-containing protein [Exiguobacterium indicum]